jgi:hypothetical protein
MKLLYKGKGDKNDLNSFRGICLSNVLLNLLDRILNLRLYSLTEHLIPANQYGFTRGRSTISAVQMLRDKVNHSLDVEKKPIFVLFLDLKKAFDSGDRFCTFKKLIDLNVLSKIELNFLAELLDVNYVKIDDGVCISEAIVQSNGYRQGGCTSPFFFNFSICDVNEILKDIPEVEQYFYADDCALISKNLNQLKEAMLKLKHYFAIRNLEFNLKKCKIVKFRRGGVSCNEEFVIDGEKIEFVNSFCYLGVTFQVSGRAFSSHIKNRVRASLQATFELKNLHLLSLETALKLFHIKVAPVASYGIEVLWPHLKFCNFQLLETVKTRYLKKAMCLSKFNKSRYIYFLANTTLFVEELRIKFNLPETDAYKRFYMENVNKVLNVNHEFLNSVAMQNDVWKRPNFEKRHIFTRYSCHGFHFIICKNKSFHEAENNCICDLCGEKCEQYHLQNCSKRQQSIYDFVENLS